MNKDYKWQKNKHWEYVNEFGHVVATIEEWDGSIEANLKYVVTLIDGDVDDYKQRVEKSISAIRQCFGFVEDQQTSS